MLSVMFFVLPNHSNVWWNPAFLWMAEQLPAYGKWWMNYSFHFAWLLFDLLSCLHLNLWVFSLLFSQVFPPSQHGGTEWVAGWCWSQTTALLLFSFKKNKQTKPQLCFMERFPFHESFNKSKWKPRGVTFPRSPAWLEHAKAIMWMFAAKHNRGANKRSSFTLSVYKTVAGITQLVHFINICW